MNSLASALLSAYEIRQLGITGMSDEEKGVIVQAGQPGKDGVEASNATAAKLWPALWSAYGWPYVSLGLLKLFGDALNFAGMAIIFAANLVC